MRFRYLFIYLFGILILLLLLNPIATWLDNIHKQSTILTSNTKILSSSTDLSPSTFDNLALDEFAKLCRQDRQNYNENQNYNEKEVLLYGSIIRLIKNDTVAVSDCLIILENLGCVDTRKILKFDEYIKQKEKSERCKNDK